MKFWAILGLCAPLILSGCEGCNDGANTVSCSSACREGGRSMERWNQKEGCICSPAVKDAGAQ